MVAKLLWSPNFTIYTVNSVYIVTQCDFVDGYIYSRYKSALCVGWGCRPGHRYNTDRISFNGTQLLPLGAASPKETL